jgi:hypothetical protein
VRWRADRHRDGLHDRHRPDAAGTSGDVADELFTNWAVRLRAGPPCYVFTVSARETP